MSLWMKRTVKRLWVYLILAGVAILGASFAGRSAASSPDPAPAPQEPEMEVFVPSEELPVDSTVSFPVDI